jgi:predicted nucleic acid-binding protein
LPKAPRRIAPARAARRVLVDSGAWLAAASPRDQFHDDAARGFRRAVEERIPLITTNLVVGEAHRLTLFRLGGRAAALLLDRIDASPRISLVHAAPEHHRAAREWLARLADHRITYTDAVSFAVMDAMACRDALTFDNDFLVAGFQRWPPPS